jgi:hypothetical protein
VFLLSKRRPEILSLSPSPPILSPLTSALPRFASLLQIHNYLFHLVARHYKYFTTDPHSFELLCPGIFPRF